MAALVDDGFSGASGTNVDGRSPDAIGPAWAVLGGGTASIARLSGDGRVYRNASGAQIYVASGLKMRDGTVTIDVSVRSLITNDSIVAYGRAVDASNYYFALLGADGILKLGKAVGGTITYLYTASAAKTLTAGNEYSIGLSMTDSTIAVSWGGTVEASVTDTSFASGGFVGQKVGASTVVQSATTGLQGNRFRAATVTPDIACNDANIVYSPGNWDVTAARALSVNPGAYLRLMVAGGMTAVNALFDVDGVAAPVPQIKYRIDQGPWTTTDLANTVPLTLPGGNAWTKHLIEVVFKSSSNAANRWTVAAPPSSVRFLGFDTTPDACTTAAVTKRPLTILAFGDSITEGFYTLQGNPPTTHPTRDDATEAAAYRLGALMGAEVGVIGFSSQGIRDGGAGSVPAMVTTYNQIISGISRSLTSPVPDIILCNEGVNDFNASVTAANFQSGYISIVNAWLTGTPDTTIVAVVMPYPASYPKAVYQAVVDGSNQPARVRLVDSTGWFNTADSWDNLHPFGYAHALIAPLLATELRAMRKGWTMVKRSDGSLKPLIRIPA